MTRLPRMSSIRQRFPNRPAVEIARALHDGLASTRLFHAVAPGQRVAVAVGSRGIACLAEVVSTAVASLVACGAKPFLVPAMGSHGGATPEGQRAILENYGLSEAALGVPIEAAMETRCLGTTPDGTRVYSSLKALEADHILLVNRIKPHTDFGGNLGSGLVKMLVVGLGKRDGAAAFHAAAARCGHAAMLTAMARVAFASVPLLGGVAIVEGHVRQPVRIEVIPAAAIESREKQLLVEATQNMPSLPFADVDLLIVDRIGKNISGTGMDPHVTGRPVEGYLSSLARGAPGRPTVRRLFVRGLTPETRGNAVGIGMADFTTRRLVDAMDRLTTYLNCLTALSLQAAKVPVHFNTDRECITHALESLGLPDPSQARIVRIADTLALEQVAVSEACLPEIESRPDLEQLTPPQDMAFDAAGNLV